jgi:coproporphyrinogen III oxidase
MGHVLAGVSSAEEDEPMDSARDRMVAVTRRIQEEVAAALVDLDGTPLRVDVWTRPGGGGGRSLAIEDGAVFEKAGVNWSGVHGELPPGAIAAMRERRGTLPDTRAFFATGVSLVLHPRNPFCPTVHANYRYFELGNGEIWWFGGGADLTPSYLFEEDARHFHRTLKEACDRHDPALYPRFKQACDNYFRIVHRGESRGIGGVFYDDLDDRPQDALVALASDLGSALVPAYFPIARRRADHPYADHHRRWQQIRRGRYVEFNLVYDRGTTFGLKTDARVESVLMSLPLTARWELADAPAPGTPEAALLAVLRTPKEWA